MLSRERVAGTLSAAIVALLMAACTAGSDEHSDLTATEASITATPHATAETLAPLPTPSSSAFPAHGPPNIIGFDSLRSMVEVRPTVVVGEVLHGASLFYKNPNQVCPIPFTISPIRVLQVIHSPDDRIESGEEIPLVQQAGPEDEGCIVVSGAGEEPLEPGKRFLFFLSDLRSSGFPGYGAPPVSRFEVTADGSVAPSGGEVMYAGPREVSGIAAEEVSSALGSGNPGEALKGLARVSVDDAAEKIRAAIAEGPLPAPPGEEALEEGAE